MQDFGFQPSDTALLSLEHPPVYIDGGISANSAKYDYFDHGCEVHVVQTYPNLIVKLLDPPPLFFSLDMEDDVARTTRWRLDKLGNRNSFGRQLEAIKNLVTIPKGGKSGYGDSKHESHGNSGRNASHQPHVHIRDALLTPTDQKLKPETIRSRLDDKWSEKKANASILKFRVDDSQLGALTHALRNRITLVQGPPEQDATAVQILACLQA